MVKEIEDQSGEVGRKQEGTGRWSNCSSQLDDLPGPGEESWAARGSFIWSWPTVCECVCMCVCVCVCMHMCAQWPCFLNKF